MRPSHLFLLAHFILRFTLNVNLKQNKNLNLTGGCWGLKQYVPNSILHLNKSLLKAVNPFLHARRWRWDLNINLGLGK
jgi:hypothetical protein